MPGQEYNQPQQDQASRVSTYLGKSDSLEDMRNISLLLVGFACVVALISPARAYPVLDDWAYAQSVGRLLDLDYRPHDIAQPSSLGHLIWGALFSLPFGQSFTALTLANLTVSAACITIFYLLLRHVAITPSHSLFGAAVLALNPMYIYLSFTFMTDVTFVMYLLGACLCFIRGVDGGRFRWLWLGSVMVSLCFLTRQIGIVLVPAAPLYLWWSRSLTLKAAIAVAALPLGTLLAYMAWERIYPTPLIAYGVYATLSYAIEETWLYISHRLGILAAVLSALGIYLAPVLWRPRRVWHAVPLMLLLVYLLVGNLQRAGTVLPQQGGIVNNTGLNMGSQYIRPVWSEWVWAGAAFVGAALVSLFAAGAWERLAARVRAGAWQEREHNPALLLYILGAMLSIGSIVISPFLFDRYMLPVLPLLVAFALQSPARSKNARPAAWRVALLCPLALFSLLAQLDHKAHASARWEAAEGLLEEGVPVSKIDAGFEWTGWHLFEEGTRIVRQKGESAYTSYPPYEALDPEYAVDDLLRPGYREIGAVIYRSWLNLGEVRRVLVQRRE